MATIEPVTWRDADLAYARRVDDAIDRLAFDLLQLLDVVRAKNEVRAAVTTYICKQVTVMAVANDDDL